MGSRSLKRGFLKKCEEFGIGFVGFAPVERWEDPPRELPHKFSRWMPEEFYPRSIYPEVATVIVIGFPIQLPILETAPSIYYHELYKTVNSLLDLRAYELSVFLNEEGYPSIYLPRDGYATVEVLLENPFAFFSHKHAAYLAGLGSFGLSNLLLTPEYGPRVRFTSIFTGASIDPDPLKVDDLCTRCLRCVRSCPVGAIQVKGEFPPPIDKKLCAMRSAELWSKHKSPCGICIKVCPVGEDRKLFDRMDMSIYDGEGPVEYRRAWDHVRRYGTL